MIKKNSKIFIAGHNGHLGSAVYRKLFENGYKNILKLVEEDPMIFGTFGVHPHEAKNNKISLVVSITSSFQEKYDAVELLKKIVEFLGGKGGGGRSDLAQGGAPFSKKFDELKSFILSLV